jgi:hypothetical protein
MSFDSMAQRLIIPKLTNGLRGKGCHAGRRGCGTILTELTDDALAARDILGHSTSKITEQHYIAPIPGGRQEGHGTVGTTFEITEPLGSVHPVGDQPSHPIWLEQIAGDAESLSPVM